MTIANNQHRGYFGFTCLTSTPPPRKYPVLTPEELKAVKWLVEGGYTSVQNYKNENVEVSYGTGEWFGTECIPIAKRLQNSTWITETPINLKELLKSQEDV